MLKASAKEISILLNRWDPLARRITAATVLADEDGSSSFTALLQIACSTNEDAALQEVAGESIARLCIRLGTVDQAPLADFSEPAYVRFDSVIAAHSEMIR